jgi:hypothetical protein
VNDRALDKLVRLAQPGSAAAVGSLDPGRGGQELLEEIMSIDVVTQPHPSDPEPEDLGETGPVSPVRRRRRSLIAVAAATAFIAAVAGPTIAFRGGDEAKIVPGAYSARAQAIAQGIPRVLLDDPAWSITHVDQFTETEGEISFTAGRRELQVNWRSAREHQRRYRDRSETVSSPEPIVVLGREGGLFSYSATDFAVMLPPQGQTFLDFRALGMDKSALVVVLSKLRLASVEEWLGAMPASVVTPDKTVAVAREMLADVPLPTGFDRSTLPTEGTNDYYQFGAAVIGTVTCAWLRDYDRAHAAGDEPGMARVDAALSTSRTWKVLQTMNSDGDYPEVVWMFADQVSDRQLEDKISYDSALGCD